MPSFTALLMAATVVAAPAPEPTPQGEAAAIAWFRAGSHVFGGADASPAELTSIATRLSGARVIGLGEATHGGHEDQLFKANLIKALVQKNKVTVVVLEANRDATRAFDAYIVKGIGDPMALMRSTSFFRAGRDEEFANLLIWLRAWNQVADTPVRIIGIDNQDAARDADFALSFVTKHNPSLAVRLRRPLAELFPAPGQDWPHAFSWIHAHTTADIATAQAGARNLSDAFADNRERWRQDPDYDEAAYAAEVAWQCLNEFEREGSDSSTEFTADNYFARRDVFMARNLLARLGVQDRAVIWAHANHVMSWLPDGYVSSGYSTLGREIKAALGSDYAAVGTTYSEATISAIAAKGQERPASSAPETNISISNSGPRDIGRLLANLPGDAAWIDLGTRPKSADMDQWVLSDYNYGWTGWRVQTDAWQIDGPPPADRAMPFDRGFDVMVWFRKMTPARRLPSPAPRPAQNIK